MAPVMGIYRIEAEVLLTWYPMNSAATLSGPKLSGQTTNYTNTNFPANQGQEVILGGPNANNSSLPQWSSWVYAQIGFHVLQPDRVFAVWLLVSIGAVQRTKELLFPPDTRTPFLINAHARNSDPNAYDSDTINPQLPGNLSNKIPAFHDTGLVFQGVITTEHQAGYSDSVPQTTPYHLL